MKRLIFDKRLIFLKRTSFFDYTKNYKTYGRIQMIDMTQYPFTNVSILTFFQLKFWIKNINKGFSDCRLDIGNMRGQKHGHVHQKRKQLGRICGDTDRLFSHHTAEFYHFNRNFCVEYIQHYQASNCPWNITASHRRFLFVTVIHWCIYDLFLRKWNPVYFFLSLQNLWQLYIEYFLPKCTFFN